jgi:hypothetical protein
MAKVHFKKICTIATLFFQKKYQNRPFLNNPSFKMENFKYYSKKTKNINYLYMFQITFLIKLVSTNTQKAKFLS